MRKSNDGPKILLLDIETAPILAFCWSLWNNNVAVNQIHSDWHLLSWSAKWLKGPDGRLYGPHNDVMYMDQRKAKKVDDDSGILKGIWALLDQADIVITQNGKAFDIKKLNARFIIHGFQPPSSFKQIDTKEIAKKQFGFTSNRLEYLSAKLCKKFVKSKHQKFAGFEMWTECLAGNIEAWKEMEKYNKIDVLALEELYIALMPWDNTINFNVYYEDEENVCHCGSKEFKANGTDRTGTAIYQRYRCRGCGTEFRTKKSLMTKTKNDKMFRRVVR